MTKKLIYSITTSLVAFFSFSKLAAAQLTNPAIGEWGTNDGNAASSGQSFVMYFIYLWRSVITIGALVVIVFFLIGAFEWITAGGDASKLGQARNRLLNAFIGLIILVTSYTLIGFISWLLFGTQFNILNPTFFFATSQ